MGSLLMRRREMVLASGEVNHLLYSLENRVVADGESINTEVRPFATGRSFTILFDMNVTKNPTASDQAYRYVLMYVYGNANFSVRKPSQYSSVIRARFRGSTDADSTGKIGTAAAGRKRIVVTHVAGATSCRFIGKMGTSAATEMTVSGSNTTDLSQSYLRFGQTGASYGLPPGTINSVKIYDYVLPQDDIDAFLA